mmetsp:Transcript_37956/g.80374  ORF Transcript_37956/g.80374 Transcript_37956/m.80374 type:complete len:219 (-) Transcript_37956:266-922(-)|eukprot:CAMPEP_0206454086 /NCGR_PEP_ID=MMETSP0324_2-20121206/20934_1 /ASSEMBLY_ACC=CAM_ASM_000836 /TAXON_ID=2866 /ORGANISM="Crypthecodinium cohnii, Strain Seligo" /LENGTH=218 /DNA_ID=CAMNT_0053924505 /DNA_START=57 /DNA_END=713 /DNA_ORIENTATION=-
MATRGQRWASLEQAAFSTSEIVERARARTWSKPTTTGSPSTSTTSSGSSTESPTEQHPWQFVVGRTLLDRGTLAKESQRVRSEADRQSKNTVDRAAREEQRLKECMRAAQSATALASLKASVGRPSPQSEAARLSALLKELQIERLPGAKLEGEEEDTENAANNNNVEVASDIGVDLDMADWEITPSPHPRIIRQEDQDQDQEVNGDGPSGWILLAAA